MGYGNSAQKWVSQNKCKIYSYVCKNYPYEDRNFILTQINSNPNNWLEVISDYYMENEEKKNEFITFLKFNSVMCILLAKRGAGKTSFMLKLAEIYNFIFEKKVYAYNINTEELPDFIISLNYDADDPYYDVPNGSLILHDECHKDFNSKDWQNKNNKKLKDFLSISRHKDISIIFSSQLASNISLDMIRYADAIILKELGMFADNDRQEFFDKYEVFLRQLTNRKDKVLVHYDGNMNTFSHKLPSFWSENISKNFK